MNITFSSVQELKLKIIMIMNTTNISFSELVKAVSNGKSYIKKHFDIDNTFYTTTIKVNEFKLDTYQNEVAVFKHIPTGASVRVKVLHPFIDNKVEKVEIMPQGKKKYIYVADYIMFEDRPTEYTMFEVLFTRSKRVKSFDIDLFCSL